MVEVLFYKENRRDGGWVAHRQELFCITKASCSCFNHILWSQPSMAGLTHATGNCVFLKQESRLWSDWTHTHTLCGRVYLFIPTSTRHYIILNCLDRFIRCFVQHWSYFLWNSHDKWKVRGDFFVISHFPQETQPGGGAATDVSALATGTNACACVAADWLRGSSSVPDWSDPR